MTSAAAKIAMPEIPDEVIPGNAIWYPFPKQKLALMCPAFERFYGGAAGGGKSDFLLGAFLSGVNQWGRNHKGIIFRQSYDELEELIERAKEIYIPLGAEYKASGQYHHMFIFPTGSTLKFRYLENEEDVKRYQGHSYTFIGFDELGNWATDFCYRYMFLRCRSKVGAPCMIIGTGNPGGRGHVWVKMRFIDFAEPYQLVMAGDTGLTRCYIPSTLDDNLYLMQNDPHYEERMKQAPGQLYRAMRFGDWDIAAGQVFEEFRRFKNGRPWHVIKPRPLGDEWFKFATMDWGYAKPYSIGWLAVNKDGRVIRYREHYGCSKEEYNVGVRKSATQAAKEAWDVSLAEGVTIMVADSACWTDDDEGNSIAKKFESVGWTMIPANKDRVNGLAMVHQMMIATGEDGLPMLQFFDTCYDAIRTIPTLMPDKNRPEDIDSKLEDHIYDELRYGIMSEFVCNPGQHIRRKNAYTQSGPARRPAWSPLHKNNS